MFQDEHLDDNEKMTAIHDYEAELNPTRKIVEQQERLQQNLLQQYQQQEQQHTKQLQHTEKEQLQQQQQQQEQKQHQLLQMIEPQQPRTEVTDNAPHEVTASTIANKVMHSLLDTNLQNWSSIELPVNGARLDSSRPSMTESNELPIVHSLHATVEDAGGTLKRHHDLLISPQVDSDPIPHQHGDVIHTLVPRKKGKY